MMLKSTAQSLKKLNGWLIFPKKSILQFVLSALFIILAIYYIRHEPIKAGQLTSVLKQSSLLWILPGVLLILGNIVLQGYMYVFSFASLEKKITLGSAVILFLKRNLVSVFLPAGGVTSLAFFNEAIEKKASSEQIYRQPRLSTQ